MRTKRFIRSRVVGAFVFLAVLILVAACGAGVPGGAATAPVTPVAATVTRSSVAAPSSVRQPTATPSPTPVPPTPTPIATEAPMVVATSAPIPPPSQEVATYQAAEVLSTLKLGLSPIAAGFSAPVQVTHAGDGSGRLIVVEQPGTIRIIVGERSLPEAFLDIRNRVGASGSEQGLLGLAFPPDFAARGYFFVNYTDRSGDTVIARFSVSGDGNKADSNSEFVVMKLDQPAANHNGGMLLFGPDGKLWVGTGDGGASNDRFGNGQNAASLLGKMLRLDITSNPAQPYSIPADNPWVQSDWDGEDVRDEVWALGLRNPWRYSFDRATGDLWIADVGQNRYEEVHRVAAGVQGGLNFGWPIMEGAHCFPESAVCDRSGLQIPLVEYEHGANGCSITGGYVYRGKAHPALAGTYLYADYCTGLIWGLGSVGDGWRDVLMLDSNLNISSFGEDETGELYVTDLRGGVYRIVIE